MKFKENACECINLNFSEFLNNVNIVLANRSCFNHRLFTVLYPLILSGVYQFQGKIFSVISYHSSSCYFKNNPLRSLTNNLFVNDIRPLFNNILACIINCFITAGLHKILRYSLTTTMHQQTQQIVIFEKLTKLVNCIQKSILRVGGDIYYVSCNMLWWYIPSNINIHSIISFIIFFIIIIIPLLLFIHFYMWQHLNIPRVSHCHSIFFY